MAPAISVIITSYNRSKYLAQAIESVLSSSFENFEIIISDDCSSDKSLQIALDFASVDKRVRVFSNDINIGDYPNRIKSIALAKGDWIKFVDCDDYISSDCLRNMFDFMIANPKIKFGICAKNISEPVIVNTLQAFEKGFIEYYGPTGSFFSRETYNNLGGFKNRITVSDWDMWSRFALQGEIAVFPDNYATWRDHEHNTLKSDSHYNGVIAYYCITKFEIISCASFPYNPMRKFFIFYTILWNTFKLSIRRSMLKFSFKPLILFISKNFTLFYKAFNLLKFEQNIS